MYSIYICSDQSSNFKSLKIFSDQSGGVRGLKILMVVNKVE